MSAMQEDENGVLRPVAPPSDFIITVESVDDGSKYRLRASDLAESLRAVLTGEQAVRMPRILDIESRLSRIEAASGLIDVADSEDVARLRDEVSDLRDEVEELTRRQPAEAAGMRLELARRILDVVLK